jgi:hypothetical protein
MMEAIIRYTCAKSEINKILNLEDLRFETLVEIVRDRLDEELKIIDYFGECDKPNLQHFFLADMIKNARDEVGQTWTFVKLGLARTLRHRAVNGGGAPPLNHVKNLNK